MWDVPLKPNHMCPSLWIGFSTLGRNPGVTPTSLKFARLRAFRTWAAVGRAGAPVAPNDRRSGPKLGNEPKLGLLMLSCPAWLEPGLSPSDRRTLQPASPVGHHAGSVVGASKAK